MHFVSFIVTLNMMFDVVQPGELPPLEALQPILSQAATLGFLTQVVFLFTLPFATAATLYAYEDILNPGE
jgi:hypothetical protein